MMLPESKDNRLVGVGPHPRPWPVDEKYDPELLSHGDRRNVLDKYRYWKVEAIKKDLDLSRIDLEIAIENWQHDFNMGTIVRNANAFNIKAIHIIGKKQWNRRGAMVTDMYMHIFYYENVKDFVATMLDRSIIAIDNTEDAHNLSDFQFPKKTVLVFGSEGPGLSQEMIDTSEQVVKIEQFGSTRSVNVGVASGIVMYEWLGQHIL